MLITFCPPPKSLRWRCQAALLLQPMVKNKEKQQILTITKLALTNVWLFVLKID